MERTLFIAALVIASAAIPIAYYVGRDAGRSDMRALITPGNRGLERPQRYTPRKPATGTWQHVATVEGVGSKTTQFFDFPGQEWRVAWTTWPDTFEGNFIVHIERDDGASKLAANVIGEASDETFGTGAGRYRLEINATQAYSIDIQSKY